jgi:phosphatidylserine/phosphatidylglycerophosphate/cardiolipin synthase-like enzyme
VRLLTQPEDGVAPLVKAIKKAKKHVDIVVFRFDRAELEGALKDAAERGVSVTALIAYANHGGEKSLRLSWRRPWPSAQAVLPSGRPCRQQNVRP